MDTLKGIGQGGGDIQMWLWQWRSTALILKNIHHLHDGWLGG